MRLLYSKFKRLLFSSSFSATKRKLTFVIQIQNHITHSYTERERERERERTCVLRFPPERALRDAEEPK